jgi:hypothetical protein
MQQRSPLAPVPMMTSMWSGIRRLVGAGGDSLHPDWQTAWTICKM